MRLFTVVFQQCELGLPLILALWYHLEKWVRRVVILLFFVALSSVALSCCDVVSLLLCQYFYAGDRCQSPLGCLQHKILGFPKFLGF